MNKNQKIILGSIIGLMLLFGLLLISLNTPTGYTVKDLKKIDLAINPIANSALIFIAEEKGYFEEQGLDIEYHNFPTGKLALDALIGGGADIATTADVPITLAGLANQPISVISTIEYSNNNIQVVARKDSKIKDPEDLLGKKIATTKGGGPLFFTYSFLDRYGIDVMDVNLVHLNPSDMVVSLVRGDIDAFIVFEPSPSVAIKQIGRENVRVFAPDDLYGETWNIVIMDDSEDDFVSGFLNALIEAEKLLRNDPKEALEIVAEYTETDEDILMEIMKKQNYGVGLTNVLTDYLDEEAKWAIDRGLSSNKKIPDYLDFIDSSYLSSIDSNKVKI